MTPAADVNLYHSIAVDDKLQTVNNDNYYDEIQDQAARENYKEKNESLTKLFPVQLSDIKGNIKIHVMRESFPKSKAIVSVSLQVFNIVECTCILEPGQYYERWFPLLPARECIQREGEVDMVYKCTMTEQERYSAFGYEPCILLRCRWIPKTETPKIQSLSYTRLQLPYCTLGFIDSKKGEEVLQSTINGVEVCQSETTEKTILNVNIKWIQIDNELKEASTPVILSPTVSKFPQPVLRFYSIKQNHLSQKDLSCYEKIYLLVQEFDIRLEQQIILSAWEFAKKCWVVNSLDTFDDTNVNDINTLGFAFARMDSKKLYILSLLAEKMNSNKPSIQKEIDENVRKVYIENFFLSALKFHVSFITSPQMKSQIESQHNQSDQNDINNEKFSSLSIFLWQVGEVVLNLTSTIRDAPIFFTEFKNESLFQSEADIIKTLQDHYVHTALGQLYKIVGSLELVGNPIGAFSSISSGVHDFFNEPVQAIKQSPTDIPNIGKGVIKGTFSLISNVAAGGIGFVSSLTQGSARVMSKLTMDPRFTRARENLHKSPRTMFGLVSRPFKDVTYAVFYSVTGVVYVPYLEWQQQNGPIAVVKGFGKGLAGGVAKIFVGGFDALTHSLTTVYDTIQIANKNKLDPVLRLRLSDLFGPDGRILPYNFENSLGTNVLYVLDQSNDEYVVGNAISGGVGAFRNVNRFIGKNLNARSDNKNFLSRYIKPDGSTSKRSHFTSKFMADHSSTKMLLEGEKEDNNEVKKTQINEFVISTTIIRKDEGADYIVIISNVRLVVAIYRRNRSGAPDFSTDWECGVDYLKPPIFERSVGKATLVIKSDGDVNSHYDTSSPLVNSNNSGRFIKRGISYGDHHSFLSYFNPDYLLKGNHKEEQQILNIYNCIQTLLGNFNEVKDINTHNNIFCDREGTDIISVGPWQFSIENLEIDSNSENFENKDLNPIMTNENFHKYLEKERWIVKGSTYKLDMSPWHEEEYNLAIDSHDRIDELCQITNELKNLYRKSPTKNREIYRQAVDNLDSGHLDYDEFIKIVETLREKTTDIDLNRTSSNSTHFKKESKWKTLKNIPGKLISSIPLINMRDRDKSLNTQRKGSDAQELNILSENESNDSLNQLSNPEETTMGNILTNSAKQVGRIVPMIRKSISIPENISLNLSMDYFNPKKQRERENSSTNLSEEPESSFFERDEIFYGNKSIKEDIDDGRTKIPFVDDKSDTNNSIVRSPSFFTEDQDSSRYSEDGSLYNGELRKIFKKDLPFTPINKEVHFFSFLHLY